MKKILFIVFVLYANLIFAQKGLIHFGNTAIPQTPATANVVINGGTANVLIENQIFDYNVLNAQFRAVDIQNKTAGSITIKNCRFGNYKGSNQSFSVYIFNCPDITIEDCFFENTCLGIRIGSSTVTNLKLRRNKFKDIDQRTIPTTSSGSSAIQLVNTTGSNIDISFNIAHNRGDVTCQSGDMFSFFNSGGTVSSRAQFTNNWCKINDNANSWTPTNFTGGSLVVEGTTGNTRYIDVVNNIFEGGSWAVQGIQQLNDISFTNNIFIVQQRNDATRGYSSGGIQFEPTAGYVNLNFSGNVVYGIRNDGVANHIYAPSMPAFTEAQISVNPAWVQALIAGGGSLLSNNILN